ncbi:RepB family protein [Aeromonas eucrenophila]|uniref:Protein CopB n=1 Tax=Aeromonas eucrenophila TaxID=649 RepID=A0ABW0YF65_9GAMM|nr:RepB family protein [Aeromonas eucrenophila]
MSQENQEITKHSEAQDNAERQRQHVKRKQETHNRLQCWISNRHAERLHELGLHLEDSQASLIEQAIDLLYQHELVPQYVEERREEQAPPEETSRADTIDRAD